MLKSLLRRSPGFALTAILTLALGIGASTAVFTAVDSIVLKPLAYRDSARLVVAWERVPFLGLDPTGPNPRHFDLWQHQATAFTGMTLLRHASAGLALGNDHPRLVGTVLCFTNVFDVLQVTPYLGRLFLPEDGVKGHDRVAVLTYSVWQNLFASDPSIVGKTVRLADVPRQVIGVLPASFRLPNRNALRSFRSGQAGSSVPEPAIFTPVVLDLTQFSWNGEYGNWIALARLRPGVPIQQAEAQLNSIEPQAAAQMHTHLPGDGPGALRAIVQPMQEAVVRDSRAALWYLMAAVIGLMLIACLNLANAQLGRTISRQREAAVRAALGASAPRLLWTSLSENLLLASIGGIAGVLLAALALALFRRGSPIDLPRLAEVHLNFTVLAFALALTIGSSLLFGILPAIRFLRADPQSALQASSARALGSRQTHRLRALLIALQVFGCTVLLLLTGLFSKSLLRLARQDKGFETARVALAEINLSGSAYNSAPVRAALDDAVLHNLRSLPAVDAAGLVSAMPLEGETWIESIRRADRPGQDGPLLNLRWSSPGYFEALRTPLIAGRFFEDSDRNRQSVILSQGLALALWPHESPVGAQVELRRKTYTVIGVVADSRNTSLKTPPARMAWLHYADQPPYTTVFMARGRGERAESLLSGLRQAVWSYAPGVTIARVKTLDAQLSDSLSAERFQTEVLVSFAVAALLLAMLGIYGVLSYSVEVRKPEIGLRMALGATGARIYRLTLGQAAAPVLAGLLAGLAASALAATAIRKSLYATAPIDPLVIALVAALFLAAATAAALLPARRAAAVDPIDALRAE